MEIGPLFRPIASKGKYNAYYLDVATAEELRRQYSYLSQAKQDAIVDVDFVLKDGDILASIPSVHHGSFDAIIASHVLEHIPNPIRFLQDCASLLKPSGVLSIALPDKRRSFDAFRPLTTTGDWIEAFREDRKGHSAKTLFDVAVYSTARNGRIAWKWPKPFARKTFVGKSLEYGYRAIDQQQDCHASVFVPASFELIAEEVFALGLSKLAPSFVSRRIGGEFFSRLHFSDRLPVDHSKRMKLLAKIYRGL